MSVSNQSDLRFRNINGCWPLTMPTRLNNEQATLENTNLSKHWESKVKAISTNMKNLQILWTYSSVLGFCGFIKHLEFVEYSQSSADCCIKYEDQLYCFTRFSKCIGWCRTSWFWFRNSTKSIYTEETKELNEPNHHR